MTRWVAASGRGLRRAQSLFWLVTILIVTGWMLSGIVLCVALVGNARNPGGTAALEITWWSLLVLAASLVALLMSVSPFVALITGLIYLLGTRARRVAWTAAWLAASAGGAAVEMVLLRGAARALAGPGVGGVAPGPVDWGPVELGAGFAVSGAAMLVLLTAAARRAPRAPRRLAGPKGDQ